MQTITIDQAVAQPTDIGRTIDKLATWQGRIYASYGDYVGDTGPIDIVSADLTDFGSGFSSEATLHTQQTWVFRNGLSGRLWVPYIDPIRGPQGDITEERALEDGSLSYAYADEPNAWTVDQVLLPYSIHGMGMVETAEALFIAGAQITTTHGGPGIWKSTDRGATWTEDLFLDSTDDFYRMYCFFDWGDGSLSCLASGVSADPIATAYHRPVNGEWTAYDDPVLDDPSLDFDQAVSDAHLFTYNGTPFQLVTANGKNNARVDRPHQSLQAHMRPGDEAVRAEIQATLPAHGLDVYVSDDGQRAYVAQILGSDGSVIRGDTAGNWTTLFHFDDSLIAGYGMTVDEANGFVYISGAAGHVAQYPLPT